MNLDTEDSTWPSRPRLGVIVAAGTYSATYPDECAGLEVTVANFDGEVIETATLTEDTPVVHSFTPPAGDLQGLIGTVEPEDLPVVRRQYDLVLDTPGASETAYFTGTLVGDTGDGETQVDLVAVGDLPDWVTIVGGEAVLGAEAGGCYASLIGKVDFDFTGTDAPDDPGHSTGVFTIKQDGSQIGSDVVDQSGDGQDLQAAEMSVAVGDFVFGGTINALVNAVAFTTAGEDDAVSPVAVATKTVAVNITRLAPAPTLP